MSKQSKTFANLTEARGFAGRLGILSFESYRVERGGKCVLSWRPLTIAADLSSLPRGGQMDGITGGRQYQVMRETELAYLFRDDNNKIIKVNRLTMMGGNTRFITH